MNRTRSASSWSSFGVSQSACRERLDWFLITHPIGLEGIEYTDAIWVYRTKDLNTRNAANKAVVLDGQNCAWSRKCIGLTSVLKVGNRLAIFYDDAGGDRTSHMNRDVGLACLELPLLPPDTNTK